MNMKLGRQNKLQAVNTFVLTGQYLRHADYGDSWTHRYVTILGAELD